MRRLLLIRHAATAAVRRAAFPVDAAPLRVTELHARDGRWTVVHANAPVAT